MEAIPLAAREQVCRGGPGLSRAVQRKSWMCNFGWAFDGLRGDGLQKALPLPLLHSHAPLVDVNPHLVLRAVAVEEARDLDLALWNRAIQAQEEASARKRAD